jgi:hypothetical protein
MDKKETISDMISYPFDREYPIPIIKNKQEFIKRYNEIFDDSLKQMIINSDPSKDWADMGWRGLMFKQGDIWIDFNGRLMTINYQSAYEKDLLKKYILDDKNNLNPALREFYRPLYILETSKFIIRIDELENYKFRYASWPIFKTMLDKPDLILYNGEFVAEGTGGNHSYQFKNGDYTYECSIIIMGEEGSPPARLTIIKDDTEILSQNATIVKK